MHEAVDNPNSLADHLCAASIVGRSDSNSRSSSMLRISQLVSGANMHALHAAPLTNDPSKWAANPWAMRSVFHVVSVHEATEAFTANVAKTMIAGM